MSRTALYFLIILAMILPAIHTYTQLHTKLSSATNTFSGNITSYVRKKRKVDLKKSKLCNTNYKDNRNNLQHDLNLTTIYFVTPTYPRPEQIPELTRLSHTLMHVPRIHWIVADDNVECSKYVLDILKRSGLPYTHLSSPKPNYHKEIKSLPTWMVSRGVPNRRAALNWIRHNVQEGIIYFGDDDNTYDLKLFSAIRNTKKLSMFPVGLIGKFGVSSPVVHNNTVVGFFDSWFNNRTFPVDMAGFAVNIKYLKRTTFMTLEPGMLEDSFLTSSKFKVRDIEPLADNCTKVLVWHTQTLKNSHKILHIDTDHVKTKYSSLAKLLEMLSDLGLVRVQRNGITGFIIQDGKNIRITGSARPQESPSHKHVKNHHFKEHPGFERLIKRKVSKIF